MSNNFNTPKPQLVNKKILKRLLRKAYNDENNTSFITRVKELTKEYNVSCSFNWFYVLLFALIIYILYELYCHNKKKKEDEQFEIQQRIEELRDAKENQQVDSYEAEYYKMLPRIM